MCWATKACSSPLVSIVPKIAMVAIGMVNATVAAMEAALQERVTAAKAIGAAVALVLRVGPHLAKITLREPRLWRGSGAHSELRPALRRFRPMRRKSLAFT